MTTREGEPSAHYRFSFPIKVLAAASALLGGALVVGLLLPGHWSAERTGMVPAPPAAVFEWIDAPRRWDEWAPLGDVATTFSGPERGVGATRSWDHPEMGDGSFTVTGATADREVRYRVTVQEGSLVTQGVIRLAAAAGGTRVVWTEEGDFGLNPLMGFMARGMDRMQGAQMEQALQRLAELVVQPR